MKKGRIKVETDHIFPIIRKWLYEDRDIFLRELVSNAADAISKYKRLIELGEVKGDLEALNAEARIDVIFDKDAHTVSISDNGIGMTDEEIDRYINQIAFSGAVDFVEKYKDQGDAGQGIIGHFGLGFYSAFMVATHVEIDSLSWQEGAMPARWSSEDGTTFEMQPGTRQTRGTTITITLSEEVRDEMTGTHLQGILDHYCAFMPWPIYFHDVAADAQAETARLERNQKASEEAAKEGKDAPEPEVAPIEAPINDTEPLWLKNPSEISDEDYKAFYRATFKDYREPLFWIHLKMDYPINLNGILYFPQKEERYENFDGRIKLFYNQVFVADDIKEVIPEFLLLLKGCIDSPDLPLNVSRSALQAEPEIKRLGTYITRKVADKLVDMVKNDRETYEAAWDDLSLFVRYGTLRDPKFFDRVKSALLFKTTDDTYLTLDDLGEKVRYTTDPNQQLGYIQRAKRNNETVLVMDDELDLPFVQMLEGQSEIKTTFTRVDAATEGEDLSLNESVTQTFTDLAAPRQLKLSLRALGTDEEASILVEDEEARNMLDMQRQFARMQGRDMPDMEAMFPVTRTLVLNQDTALVSEMIADDTSDARRNDLAAQLYDMARLAHGSLSGDELLAFIKRTQRMVESGSRD